MYVVYMATNKQVIDSIRGQIRRRGYAVLEGTCHNPHLDPPVRSTIFQLRRLGYIVELSDVVCYTEEHKQYYYCFVVKE
jgi:hypothetical protein